MKLPLIKIPKLEKKELILVGAIAVVGVGFFFKKVYLPMNEKTTALLQDLEKRKGELRTLLDKVARLDYLQKELDYLREKDKEALRKLPRDPDVPGLLRLLNNLLKQHSIQYTSLTLGKPSPREIYNELSVDLALSGTFHTLGSFLAAVGQQERVIKGMSLTISPKTTGAAGTGPIETLSSNLKLMTYTSK